MEEPEPTILYVCTNYRSGAHSSCASRGSRRLLAALQDEVQARNLNIKVEPIVCLGECEKGPNMRFAKREILSNVRLEDIGKILDSAMPPERGAE